jgi:hypothetical protein
MKELVGQGKPFYSAVDKAAGLLKRKVGTGAEFMQELKGLGGIKQSEIEDRGLGEIMGAPKMTHEQFMAALAAKPAPAIREKILDVGNTDDPRWLTQEERNNPPENLTHHENYTLPGGKNYREMLIKAPAIDGEHNNLRNILEAKYGPAGANSDFATNADKKLWKDSLNKTQSREQFQGVGAHFGGEKDILASMRLKDRTGPNGEKLLHLEELQSDWHQQGRDKGYKKTPEELQAERQLKQKAHDEYVKNESNTLNEEYKTLKEKMRNTPNVGTATPDQLHQLGLKLLAKTHIANFESPQDVEDLRAIQKQYDQLKEANDLRQRETNILRQLNILSESSPSEPENRGVPNAPFKKNWEEMALKRLIHHAAEKGYHGIVVTPGAEQADRYSLAKHIDDLHYSGTNLVAYDGEGNEVIKQTGVTPQDLPSFVGKELAEKLMAQKPQGTLGDTVRSLRGVDMEVGGEGMKGFYDKKVPNILNTIGKKHGVKTQLHAIPLPKKGRERTDEEFVQALRNDNLVNANYFNLPDEVKDKYSYHPEHVGLHHFPITEEMRKDVLTNGLPLHREGGIIHKAVGGTVQPSMNQMRAELMGKKPTSLSDLSTIGANEAPNMNVKVYVPPSGGQLPVGGVSMGAQPLPIGGIDMSQGQQGNQLMPASLVQPPQPPQGGQPPQAGGMPSPLSAGASSPAQQPPSNILQMTPQGQALNAMSPPKMAEGGGIPMTYKVGGSDNMPEAQPSWYQDDGESTFNIDNLQQLAKGGDVDSMKKEIAKKKSLPKRVLIKAEGRGGVKGIVVPRHLIEGNPNASAEGLKNMMKARAKVYGAEHRDPLDMRSISDIHKQALSEHFAKPIDDQRAAEQEALNRLREAKFIKDNRDTLDESEKLDTVNHEYDAQGRSHVGYASKGIAGRALFPKGHGKDMDYEVINTCPGQTTGCGGGVDAQGIVDTKRGSCFAPNAESQYAAAVSRRAGHAIAKHDPAMTKDWIIAHTGSMRNAAEKADTQNKRMLFRPNVVDETDTTSRHVIRHLNSQRKAEGRPDIISNQYGKTNELHDPENGYYVTHSNIGPKVKHGQEIAENIGRDKARVRNTIMAADNKGDFVNEQGNKTPPKGSYFVTDVKRGSPMSKKMEGAIKHAKYWSTGRSDSELTEQEKAEGPEGHFGGNGKPTTEDKSHYGHTTHKGLRYDYQRQHILHPRLVQVGHNDDGTAHMIPTDSRFKDEDFLPKNRFKTKNGKVAGHILMTTPTESTDLASHQTTFTHNVNASHIDHALKNKGEYEVDRPEDQEKAKGKEYVAPKPINIPKTWKLANGGSINLGRHPGYGDDNFHAFPEQNVIAQRHLAMRDGEQEEQNANQMTYHSKHKKPVSINKKLDTMRLELTMKKAK